MSLESLLLTWVNAYPKELTWALVPIVFLIEILQFYRMGDDILTEVQGEKLKSVLREDAKSNRQTALMALILTFSALSIIYTQASVNFSLLLPPVAVGIFFFLLALELAPFVLLKEVIIYIQDSAIFWGIISIFIGILLLFVKSSMVSGAIVALGIIFLVAIRRIYILKLYDVYN